MNDDSKEPLTIAISGTFTIARNELERLTQRILTANPQATAPAREQSLRVPEGGDRLPRLSFTVKETAEVLGISQATVYRLLYRGLLKSSLALRSKLIARSEIERFLRDTTE